MSRQSEANRPKGDCAMCVRFMPIKAKGMCQNCWHKVKRKTQPGFFLRTRYTEMRQRVTRFRSDKPQYFGLPICTRAEFLVAFENSKVFLDMFYHWKNANHEQHLCPSIDRIDNNRGYTLDNMQWLTHAANGEKAHALPVIATRPDGKQKWFKSQMEAARQLDLEQANIWKVLQGERRHTGKYKFRYA